MRAPGMELLHLASKPASQPARSGTYLASTSSSEVRKLVQGILPARLGSSTARMVCRFAKSVMEAHGVMETAITLAKRAKSLLQSHLDTWCLVWDMVTSLRVKLLFLTGVTLMLLLTCVLDPLLTLVAMDDDAAAGGRHRRPAAELASLQWGGLLLTSPALALVNATLVAQAAVDPAEAEERRIIGKALHYPAPAPAAGKRLRWPKTDGLADQESHSREQWRERKPEPWETDLSGPLYWGHWAGFRDLLAEWADKKTRFEPRVMAELLEQVKAPLDAYYYGQDAAGASGAAAGIRSASATCSGSSEQQQVEQPDDDATDAAAATTATVKRYKTCAVVGNSGVLLTGASHGAFIDSHDMVIRINMAPTKGYASRVGSKTTLSFINSNILHTCAKSSVACTCYGHYHPPIRVATGGATAGPVPVPVPVPVAAYMCTPLHLMDIARCRSWPAAPPLLVTDPRFDTLCSRIVKWYSLTVFAATSPTGTASIEQWNARFGGKYFHYSSGFQAVMLALGLCHNVNMFGFGKVPGVGHHYHSKQKEELSLHDYQAEYMFYDDVMHNRSADIPFLQDSGIAIPPLRIFL